jgi:hypothetical protein
MMQIIRSHNAHEHRQSQHNKIKQKQCRVGRKINAQKSWATDNKQTLHITSFLRAKLFIT